METQIQDFKQASGIPDSDELLPETYLKLRYPDDKAMQDEETQILVRQEHFISALGKITPSISLEELRRYEELRDKYSSNVSAAADTKK